MQTDLTLLFEDAIRSIVKKNPLTEEHAQILIMKEKKGRGRKRVIQFLAAQARKSKQRRNLKQIQEVGLLLPTVCMLARVHMSEFFSYSVSIVLLLGMKPFVLHLLVAQLPRWVYFFVVACVSLLLKRMCI